MSFDVPTEPFYKTTTSSTSRQNKIQFCHRWRIPHFPTKYKDPKCTQLSSQTVKAGTNNELAIYLTVHIQAEEKLLGAGSAGNKKCVTYTLLAENSSYKEAWVTGWSVSILTPNGELARTIFGSDKCLNPGVRSGLLVYSGKSLHSNEFLKTAMALYLHGEDQSVVFEASGQIVMWDCENNISKTVLHGNSFDLQTNMHKLLQNQQFCDITITVGDVEFGAHKAVLMTRSQFMHDLFSETPDITYMYLLKVSPAMFKEALQFMYTGQCSTIAVNPHKLIPCAVYLTIKPLIEACKHSMFGTTDIDKIFENLLCADKYKLVNVRNHLARYIADYATKNRVFIEHPAWKILKLKASPDLRKSLFLIRLFPENATNADVMRTF